MRIAHCIASRQNKENRIEFEPNKGLTVIYGDNGAGKTIIARTLGAIAQILSKGDIPSDNAFPDTISVTARVQCGNSFVTCVRNGNAWNITDEASEVQTSSSDRKKSISSFLPHLPAYLLREISFVPSSLEGIFPFDYQAVKLYLSGAHTKFYKRIQGIGGIPDESGSFFAKRLAEEITKCEDSLRKIDRQLDIASLTASRAKKLMTEKKEIEKENSATSMKLSEINEVVSKLKNSLPLRGEISVIEEKIASCEEDLANERETQTRLGEAKQKLISIFPQFSSFTQSQRESLGKIQNIYRAIRNANERIDSIVSLIERRNNAFIHWELVMSIILLPTGILGALGFIPRIEREVQTIGAIVCSSLWAVLSAGFYIGFKLPLRKLPITEAHAERDSAENELREILCRNSVSLEGLTSGEAYEFLLQYFEEYGSFLDHEDDTLSIEQSLRGENFAEQVDSARCELAKQRDTIIHDIETSIKEAAKIMNVPEDTDPDQLSHLIEELYLSMKSSLDQSNELADQLDRELSRSDQPFDTESMRFERDTLAHRLERLSTLERTVRFISELLDEATVRRETALIDSCASEAHGIIHAFGETHIEKDQITAYMNGRYKPENPSSSHMIHLALSLAIGSMACAEGESIPLILDEPSSYMDGTRVKKFIEIARQYADKRQIIVFTHDRAAFDGLIDIVEIPPDALHGGLLQ